MSSEKQKGGRIAKLFGQRFRAGSYSAFAAAVVIAIMVFVNLAVNLLPTSVTQLDMTGSSLYTLSDQTRRIVSSLDKDVDMYLLATTGSEDSSVLRLLNRYADLSSHIHVEAVDPDVQPGFLDNYDLSVSRLYANSVIVQCGDKYRLVGYDDIYVTDYSMDYTTYNYTTTTSFDGENSLTNAIHYVSSDSLPKAYTLTGHGETELDDSITEALAQDNFETESLSLLTMEAVPEDASVIIINAPTSDLNETEAGMLITWLQNGGSVALTTGYIAEGEMPNLLSVTEAMGMTLQTGVVIESDASKYYPRYPYYLLPTIESHDITEALIGGGYYTMVPLAEGITETGSTSAEVSWLLTTSDSAYGKAAGMDMTTTEKEDGDTDGPFHVGAISVLGEGKLLWITSDAFLNSQIDQVVSGANSDLYLNAMNYMVQQEESISIRAKSMDDETLTVPASDSTLWSIIMIGGIPAVFAVFGILIWIRRKRR